MPSRPTASATSVKRCVAAIVGLLLLPVVLAGCGAASAVRSERELCESPMPLAAGTTEHSTEDGRTFLLHVPPAYDGSVRRPVVVLFHGLGGTADLLLETTQMVEEADESGFLVVVPQGLAPGGDKSRWDFHTPATTAGSDLGFANALVDEAAALACIDEERVYAAGFSNGAVFALALACAPQTRYAAFGAVAGPWWTPGCEKAPARPVAFFHGTEDVVVPIAGAGTSIGPLPSLERTAQQWADHNGCTERGLATRVAEHVDRVAWNGCPDGSDVVSWTVVDGGHAWPGGLDIAGSPRRGHMTQEINASGLLWAFFQRHPRTSPAS